MADRVLVALLAAGRGRRFGGGKLDASCAGRPLGGWAVRAVELAGATDRGIVVPARVPRCAHAAGWPLAINPHADDGLATSLALAADHAIQSRAAALLVLLADMPMVDAAVLQRLLASPAPAAIAHAPDRPGVPAVFPADMFPRLRTLTGDRGAASLLRDLPGLALVRVPVAMLLDVDDAAGLQHAAMLLQKQE